MIVFCFVFKTPLGYGSAFGSAHEFGDMGLSAAALGWTTHPQLPASLSHG